MSAMEKSLRRALDAGDAFDPAFRETIYAASERALERMIAERPLDEDAAQAQRIRLAETINRVEQDYYQAAAAGGVAPQDEPWPDDGTGPAGADEAYERDHPVETSRPAGDEDEAASGGDLLRAARTDEPAENPFVDAEAPAFLRRTSEPTVDRSKVPAAVRAALPAANERSASRGFGNGGRSSPGRFRRIFAIVVLLAFLLLAYLVYGMIYGPTETGEPTAGATTSQVAPAAEGGRWIALFDGTQLGSIATPTGGRVETFTTTGARQAVRLSSTGEGGEIEVAVGPGVAREMAGETVRVELTVGSPDGQPREFGVRCLFSGRTVCGTQRFRTAQASESFVFDMTVPSGARSAGSIAIEPGFRQGGRPLDLYGLRARLSDAA